MTSDRAYIFLDESGNLDFGPKGSRYFVLTSVVMHRPFPVSERLEAYKYDCIENGANIEYFHCHDDRNEIRDAVFDAIVACLEEIRIDCLIVEKARVYPTWREGLSLYSRALDYLLRRALREESDAGVKEVIVITDALPVNRKRRTAEKSIQRAVAENQIPGMTYRILHHKSRSHYGLQVADYCCWAIFRKWQKGQSTWYDRLKPAIRNEFVPFGEGK